jgi:hypothetical protein
MGFLAPLSMFVVPDAVPAKPVECQHLHDQSTFHQYARKAFRGHGQTTRFERRTLGHIIQCQIKPRARVALRKHRAKYRHAMYVRRQAHRRRVEIRSITPYDCGSAGRWAIPCYVIKCESGYSWTAYNPSGARGPYQFLGWNVPWPVTSAADRLAHHRFAKELWAGGAGAGNWVCA